MDTNCCLMKTKKTKVQKYPWEQQSTLSSSGKGTTSMHEVVGRYGLREKLWWAKFVASNCLVRHSIFMEYSPNLLSANVYNFRQSGQKFRYFSHVLFQYCIFLSVFKNSRRNITSPSQFFFPSGVGFSFSPWRFPSHQASISTEASQS